MDKARSNHTRDPILGSHLDQSLYTAECKRHVMTGKLTKTILFASLIATMILPFGIADISATSEQDDKNPRDKTAERMQEKEDRQVILQKIKELVTKENKLEEKIESMPHGHEKEEISSKLNEIRIELDKIYKENHKKDLSEADVKILIEQQTAFEEDLRSSTAVRFVTSVGIDITSKEIQIGLNRDIVNSENIDSVVAVLEEIVPKHVKWHVVYSSLAESLSCTQDECTPIIGGNYIKVTESSSACSFGFQAKKDSTWGWITAGHCADGLVGNGVRDYSGDTIGTVSSEEYYWGTYCDCAWITASSSLTDNKVFGFGTTHTITKTTQASEQQNDTIMKSGQAGGLNFGTVSAINVSVYNTLKGEHVKKLVRSDTLMEHGDSGGTIVESSDRGDLYGIVTTHDLWGNYHTPIDQITANMGVSPVLN